MRFEAAPIAILVGLFGCAPEPGPSPTTTVDTGQPLACADEVEGNHLREYALVLSENRYEHGPFLVDSETPDWFFVDIDTDENTCYDIRILNFRSGGDLFAIGFSGDDTQNPSSAGPAPGIYLRDPIPRDDGGLLFEVSTPDAGCLSYMIAIQGEWCGVG